MGERWATFDCYGTLVDWNGGIRGELARLVGEAEVERLLARYHELEPQIQVEDPSRSYRHVLIQALERLAAEQGVSLEDGERDALPRSLPGWPVFAEVPDALEEARTRGWRLGILSNTDQDLIAASVERIGVPFDDVIAASSIGSYKPGLGHWRAFERSHGRLPDVHVAASLFHDIGPARELGLPSVWVNRLAEDAGSDTPSREIGDLSPLPDVLDELRDVVTLAHRPITPADAAAAAELITAYESAFLDEPDLPSEQDVLDWWKLAMDGGSTAVTDNGRLVGLGILRDRGGKYEADNFVHPDFAGHGIGTLLIELAEGRARKDGVGVVRAVTLGQDLRGRELFERRGFRYIRSFYRMLIDLTGPPTPPVWPAGFAVEPLTSGEERVLFETVEEAFADHWEHVARTFEEWLATHRLDPELCFLVRQDGTVVAAAINQEERFGAGWVDILGVRAPWRRRGLGEALLRLAFVELYERGKRRVGLGVDAENATGATRLYERVAMRVASQADVFEKRLGPVEAGSAEVGTRLVESMGESRVDVSIERKQPEADGTGRRDPNTCPACESHYRDDELAAALRVCPQCGHHFPMPAWERIASLTDEGSFDEEAADLRSADPLDFFDLRPYRERLAEAELATGLGEAIIVGRATLDGHPCALAVMDFSFMGGSMGSAVGEKFARACETAADRRLPLVSVTASGGARMQEGILSLMQLPKTVCAVEDLHDAGSPMFSVMAHPTTAGVLASFASLGDVTLAEPGALLAFTGPRVVQQTTRERLPEDFGQAESNYRFGHVDAIVPRPELRSHLSRLVRLFAS